MSDSEQELERLRAEQAAKTEIKTPARSCPNTYRTARRIASIATEKRLRCKHLCFESSIKSYLGGMNNTITVIGYVGQKPTLKIFDSGKKVANFSLAVNDYANDGATTWFDVQAWNGFADIATEHISKGREIVVQGRLGLNEYTDKDNCKVTKPIIQLYGLHLCGSAPRKREEVSNDNQLANIS